MPKAALYSAEGVRIGDIELQEDVFGIPVNEHVLHQAVVRYLAGRRRGTASTKTRGEVSGGGRKPWRQKGTGRARAGSIRSPIWRGGGIVFGPKPRSYAQDLPRKVRRLALKSALSSRAQDGDIVVIEEFRVEEPKTKRVVKLLEALEAERKVLLVTGEKDRNLQLASRNLPGVRVVLADHLNPYDVLAADKVVLTKDAVAKVGEVLANA
ncbi:MAG: 50S ribosomal protein L4 [Thermoanaerobacterales bacterium 50_218]|nr:MAG: 50S ribosomal protein L4 [Thermoanaerobacterales bacterium 50_218]HAA90131.1 50S ribosomal protein L4 [Peptococcaceae bacterium]